MLGAGSGVDGVVVGVVGLGLVVGIDAWELLLFRQATSSPDLSRKKIKIQTNNLISYLIVALYDP